ncbi:MAG: hypothetical protein QME32_00295 [Endomicrobiia bacterium]|nr:hypothetical protein [Endomicrobiia bacterium]
MALDVETVLNSVLQTLKDNTITMIASLTTATDILTIKAGDSRSTPVEVGRYPAILVQLMREAESFAQLGQRNNKHELEFAIVPLVYEGDSAETADKDVRTLSKNIKSVLKSGNNITLSGTALWSMPESVDYFAADLNGTYCSGAIITLRTQHLST